MVVFLLVCSLGPATDVPRVDLVEINTVQNEKGVVRFRQVILWRWSRLMSGNGHRVAEFYVDPDFVSDARRGTRRRVVWIHRGRRFEVSARSFEESTTRIDPELADREILPLDNRLRYHDQVDRTPEHGGD